MPAVAWIVLFGTITKRFHFTFDRHGLSFWKPIFLSQQKLIFSSVAPSHCWHSWLSKYARGERQRGVRPICDEGSGSSGDSFFIQDHLDPEISGGVLREVAMLCWSRWTCGLLVRTGVFWDTKDCNGTFRRAGRQVWLMFASYEKNKTYGIHWHQLCRSSLSGKKAK